MPGQRNCLLHHNRSRSFRMHCREWLHMGSIRSERNLSPHTTLPESEGNSHSDTSRWKDYQCQGLPHRWSKHIRYMYRIPHDRIRAILRKSLPISIGAAPPPIFNDSHHSLPLPMTCLCLPQYTRSGLSLKKMSPNGV